MPFSFRDGLYFGLSAALCFGLFLLWLWQPARQVRRHTQKLLHQIEARNWSSVSDSIDLDYNDQWGNDRARVVERMREVMRYMREVRIVAQEPLVKIENHKAIWSAKVTLDGDAGEPMTLVKERINSLATPFELEWRRISAKPWDWKLLRVGNPELHLPSDFE